MLQRLVYSKFTVANVDLDGLDKAELEPFPTVPSSKFRWKILFSQEAVQAVVEDWFKDNPVEWTYWIDSIFYVLSGRCEVSAWQPPNWTEQVVQEVGPGDIFLMPRGCRASFRVGSDEPFRHIVLDIPNAGYDVEELAAGTAGRKRES
jgi:mannose-6-phosphate isomerase-like protein (cupin superfamily)